MGYGRGVGGGLGNLRQLTQWSVNIINIIRHKDGKYLISLRFLWK